MAAATKALAAALLVGTVVHGLGKGISSTSNFHDNFYNFTLGDPNADQAMLGTRIDPMEIMAPLPAIIPTRMNIVTGKTPGIPKALRVLSGVESGLINGATVGDYFRGNTNGLFNINDSNNIAQLQTGAVSPYRNAPPRVDGSVVFGAYNARYGS